MVINDLINGDQWWLMVIIEWWWLVIIELLMLVINGDWFLTDLSTGQCDFVMGN